jgi:hypothetical protein
MQEQLKVTLAAEQVAPLAMVGSLPLWLLRLALGPASGVPLYNAIYRFDDEMLVTPYLYRLHGYQHPLLHLRQLGAGAEGTGLRVDTQWGIQTASFHDHERIALHSDEMSPLGTKSSRSWQCG